MSGLVSADALPVTPSPPAARHPPIACTRQAYHTYQGHFKEADTFMSIFEDVLFEHGVDLVGTSCLNTTLLLPQHHPALASTSPCSCPSPACTFGSCCG